MIKKDKTETATFAMGCFWKPQLLFDKIPGVIRTEVGYMGGDESHVKVTYQDVCSDETGHAEVVQIEFNPRKVDYEELLDIFWKNHNPTTMNRQGPDMGTQYRSAIFYYNERQKKEAESSKKEAQKNWENEIVTKIVEAGKFYKAEEYHQNYLKKNRGAVC